MCWHRQGWESRCSRLRKKLRNAAESTPQALKRGHILRGFTERVTLVRFSNLWVSSSFIAGCCKKKAPPKRGSGDSGVTRGQARQLIRHYDRINHVDHAIRLKHVGDCDHGGSAFFVFQFNVLAIVQSDPELTAFHRG